MAESRATATGVDKLEISQIERILSASELGKDSINHARIDAEVARYVSSTDITISPTESSRLKKLIDRRVLVIMIVTYFLQAIDKGTMSFTSIMHIREDLGISLGQFPWLTTCIYIAVLVVEYPTNYVLARVPIAKYLGANIVLWGAVLALHAACRNFASLVAVRTLLGVFEACCQPAFLILSSI
jgi:hypothetical protein